MNKIYLKLTRDQINRGVVFSSTLSYIRTDDVIGLNTHEVFETDENRGRAISKLLEDSFFDNSLFKYNVIRK